LPHGATIECPNPWTPIPGPSPPLLFLGTFGFPPSAPGTRESAPPNWRDLYISLTRLPYFSLFWSVLFLMVDYFSNGPINYTPSAPPEPPFLDSVLEYCFCLMMRRSLVSGIPPLTVRFFFPPPIFFSESAIKDSIHPG